MTIYDQIAADAKAAHDEAAKWGWPPNKLAAHIDTLLGEAEATWRETTANTVKRDLYEFALGKITDLEAQHAADQQRIADAVILLSERGEMQARIAELEAELRLFSDDQKRYTAEAAFDRMKRTELEAEVARLRDACEQAETAITDGVLGGDEEYSRLAQPYAQATLDVLRKAMKP